MRVPSTAAVLFAAATCLGADEAPTAIRVVEKAETTFPAKSLPDGVKRLTDVLESCHDVSDGTVPYTADDVEKARRGDHVRFVFPTPVRVDVRRKGIEMSEAVYAGCFYWLVCGKEVVRCSKYTPDKWEPFMEWYRQTLPAD